MENENKLYFSEDKTIFSFVGDDGIHINTTGHKVDPKLTLPSPCECGSIFFEGEKDYISRMVK